MAYALPTNTSYVSCSWQCHRDRRPPSSEPGTDYASAYRSPLYAVGDGVVTAVQTSSGGATGRFIQYLLSDGRETRSLHLAQTWVHVGQRVKRGQQIGLTGASGFGSEWGYGAHVHQTLWPGRAWAAPTIDFAKYVGDTAGGGDKPLPPDEEDEDMGTMRGMKGAFYKRQKDGAQVYLLFNEESGFWVEHTGVQGNYNNSIAQNWLTGSWPSITEAHARVIKSALNVVQPKASPSALTVEISQDDGDDAANRGVVGDL